MLKEENKTYQYLNDKHGGNNMAKTINCPQCDGKGNLGTTKTKTTYPDGGVVIVEEITLCPNPECNDGVIVIETND